MAKLDGDMNREHYKEIGLIKDLFLKDKEEFFKLPEVPFEVYKYEFAKADNYGKVKFDTRTYSSSPNMAKKQVMIKVGAYDVEILDDDSNLIVKHNRLYGKQKESMIWIPYLELMAKRPTALKYTGFFNKLPTTLKTFLENCDYECKKKTLKTFVDMTVDSNIDNAIDAFEEGIKCGAKMVWANEIDKYACTTYRENFGDEFLVEGDIHDINAETIPDFDIITSGFPCQAFSIAGERKGFLDKRGNLFFETLRVIEVKRPRAFLIENVKNLMSHDGGKTFNVIYSALKDSGYHIRYKVLNSMEYGNVPQNTERIYMVGFKSKEESDAFYFPDPVPLINTVNTIINKKDEQDTKYYYTSNSRYYNMLDEAMINKESVYQLRRVYVRENKSKVCQGTIVNYNLL